MKYSRCISKLSHNGCYYDNYGFLCPIGFNDLKTELKDYLKKFAENGKVSTRQIMCLQAFLMNQCIVWTNDLLALAEMLVFHQINLISGGEGRRYQGVFYWAS